MPPPPSRRKATLESPRDGPREVGYAFLAAGGGVLAALLVAMFVDVGLEGTPVSDHVVAGIIVGLGGTLLVASGRRSERPPREMLALSGAGLLLGVAYAGTPPGWAVPGVLAAAACFVVDLRPGARLAASALALLGSETLLSLVGLEESTGNLLLLLGVAILLATWALLPVTSGHRRALLMVGGVASVGLAAAGVAFLGGADSLTGVLFIAVCAGFAWLLWGMARSPHLRGFSIQAPLRFPAVAAG